MKRIFNLCLLCITAIMAASQEHNRLTDDLVKARLDSIYDLMSKEGSLLFYERSTDSLMMARVDSIYNQLSKEDCLLVSDRSKRDYEHAHHFVRAALCGWRHLSNLTRLFGSDIVDYYLADGAVEDYYGNSVGWNEYNNKKNYLAGKKNSGSYYFYEWIQWLTCNFSQLSDRAYRFDRADLYKKGKWREMRVIDLDDMRIIDSLHHYPANYAYFRDSDMTTMPLATRLEDYDKNMVRVTQLLEEKRATIGSTHPGYALTLSDMAYLLCVKRQYSQAIELQRQALAIYRTTGCQTAIRLSARFLSQLCVLQRCNTISTKSATHDDYVQRLRWAQQEIDSLGPLLGPDSPEMSITRDEIKEWEMLRQNHVSQKAQAHIDSIISRLSHRTSYSSPLMDQLGKADGSKSFESNHHYVRAALSQCQLYNTLCTTFGQAVCDTVIKYRQRASRYITDKTSLEGLVYLAIESIIKDNSTMDTRIVNIMGETYRNVYARDYHKQFSLTEAMPMVKAHQYPEKHHHLYDMDDELAQLIVKEATATLNNTDLIEDAMTYASQLLDEKAATIGCRHPGYALTLSDLAELYMHKGNKIQKQDTQRDSLYEQAIQLQQQAINIYHKAHLPVAERMSVQFLSNLFYHWDKIQKASLKDINDSTLAVFTQRKQRELRYTVPILGEQSPEVLAARHELALLQDYPEILAANRHERGNDEVFTEAVALYRQGQYKKAEEKFLSLKDEYFKYLPDRNEYVNQWVAACHLHLGDTALAALTDPYYLLPPINRTQTLEIDYLMRYDNNYRNVLKMAVDTLGAGTPELARMLLTLFEVYSNHSQFADAADALSRAKTLCRSLIGEENPLYANILSNLANLYKNIHYYQEAVLTLEESAALTARLQGRHSAAYSNLLETIVACSKEMEDNRRVARWLQERLNADTMLTTNDRTALMYDYLKNATAQSGVIFTDTVIQQRAANYARQVLDYQLRLAYSKRPPMSDTLSVDRMYRYYRTMIDVLNVVQAQTICYKNIGLTDNLKEIENQWSVWMNDSVGWNPDTPWKPRNEEHILDCCFAVSRLTFCYIYLGFVFKNCGNYELATEAFRRAADNQSYREHNMRLLVRENAAVYNLTLYVANVMYALNRREQKQYNEARDILLKAQRRRKEIEGENGNTYNKGERFLIDLLNKTGEHDAAAEHLNRWWDYQSNAILRQLVVLNGPQRELLWNQKKGFFEKMAQCEALLTEKTQTWGMLYDNALLCKGLLLNTEMEIERAISRDTNTEQAALYRQLKQNQLLLMSELQKPKSARTVDTDSLQSFIRTQSYNLMNTLQGDRSNDLVRNLRTSWTDVVKRLGKKDVAVEFIAVPMKDDSIVYAALTLRQGYEQPRLTTLCTLQQLKEVPAADYYGSSKLYDLLWRPLESELQEAKNIYFAPIDKLHQIGIEYLPGMEQYNTYRLSSTRELVTATVKKKRPIDAALYGGLNFELSANEREALDGRRDNAGHTAFRDTPDLSQLRELRGAMQEMPVLEGSLHEVEDIDRLMRKKHISVTTAMGNNGTEEDFKALSGQHKSLIHISTHGFYQPEQPQQNDDNDDLLSLLGGNQQAQTQEDHSLSRSGLLMTGAADYIFGRVDNLSTDDGILTAREISRLDLSGLDLVVLSACETGLGDISGEGVFGLQRGFKKAGAQTLLVSLWKVDDEATQLLMTEFYRGLLNGKTKRQAFIDAQRYLRQAQNGRFNRYECWAAFVMID